MLILVRTHTIKMHILKWLIDNTLDRVVLTAPDFKAAGEPWNSGRPFEAYLDASDEAWCIVLCQLATAAGTPRPVGMVCRSFPEPASRWSAFEREYCAFKEGYEAISKWVEGFSLFMFFDHKNIRRAESVLATRRAAKKLVNWIADTQHILANVTRAWIEGKSDILADAGSRLDWKGNVARQLPIPGQSIHDMVRMFFTSPVELEKRAAARRREMDIPEWLPCGIEGDPNIPRDSSVCVGPLSNEGPRLTGKQDFTADVRLEQVEEQQALLLPQHGIPAVSSKAATSRKSLDISIRQPELPSITESVFDSTDNKDLAHHCGEVVGARSKSKGSRSDPAYGSQHGSPAVNDNFHSGQDSSGYRDVTAPLAIKDSSSYEPVSPFQAATKRQTHSTSGTPVRQVRRRNAIPEGIPESGYGNTNTTAQFLGGNSSSNQPFSSELAGELNLPIEEMLKLYFQIHHRQFRTCRLSFTKTTMFRYIRFWIEGIPVTVDTKEFTRSPDQIQCICESLLNHLHIGQDCTSQARFVFCLHSTVRRLKTVLVLVEQL